MEWRVVLQSITIVPHAQVFFTLSSQMTLLRSSPQITLPITKHHKKTVRALCIEQSPLSKAQSQQSGQSFDVDLSRCAVSKRIVNRSLLINATSTVRQKPIQFLKTHSYYLDIRRILTRAIIRYPV
eukprot:843282_1